MSNRDVIPLPRPNLTVRLSATVYREDSFAFRIYPNDHDPPHVYAIKGDGFVKIALGRESGPELLKVGKQIAEQDVTRAVQIVEREHNKLLDAWKKVHGETSTDG